MTTIDFPSQLIYTIVSCIEDAVGDDIRADVQNNDLQTRNSVPARIWDILNTNLLKRLNTDNCSIARAHRGPWEMLVIYEKSTQCIITFMREKRFSELRKRQRKRSKMHYVDMLARQFNRNLSPDQHQFCLFSHIFSDEDRLNESVGALLHNLNDDADIVRNHVLVLFETSGYQLTSVRAIMVTPNLEIACEQNWSSFIRREQSIIVEKVSDAIAPENQPNHGLKLKSKAIARQKARPEKKKNTTEAKKEG